MTATGVRLGRYRITRALTRAAFVYRHPMLEQTLAGIHFTNPIGLAAGFDKNAQLTATLPQVGFGFAEVGSITGEPCAGNAPPRLHRLPHSKSLLVYYGLKNDGARAITERLRDKHFAIPIGMSIAKTNNRATCDTDNGIQDYAKAFSHVANLGAYTTINISCPNTFGGEPFTDPDRLERLLSRLDQLPTTKPIFIKLAPDLDMDTLDSLIAVAEQHRVQGYICSNLTKNRNNPLIKDQVPTYGGLSGKVVEPLANKLLARVYQQAPGKIIIGCGGVFSAEDAYKKIRLGASLVQLITGMIYQGPQLIGQINQGLVRLLKRDGYKNISQAIGVDNPAKSRRHV